MSRYRKWVLTLGIVAATPGLAAAGPFSFGQSQNDDAAAAASSPKAKNQKVAEDIAVALKKAAFHGYEIDIEYKDGLAILHGKVSDPRQKARANQIVSAVSGVHRVENKLVVVADSKGPIHQVSGYDNGQGGYYPPAAPNRIAANQEKAVQVGRALQAAGLSGYDIEVMYQDGQALLRGTVATAEQRAAAARVASQVPAVYSVTNQLRIEGQPAPRYTTQTAYQPVPGQGGPYMAAAAEGGPPPSPQGVNPAMPPGPPPGGAPMPATGPAPRAPIYDNPNVPEYAWPAYAQYPNYAAVTYPSQYSASAWPYIGPFYPYPQVPLNWRKVSLEWEDGNWNLKFDSRTDKWWWFLNPRNW